MSGRKMNFRPPMSDDSDDSYDGFYFDDFKKKEPRVYEFNTNEDLHLQDAVLEGNLDLIKSLIEKLNFKINSPLDNGYTLLIMACSTSRLEIVEYLLDEMEADPNLGVSGYTPLHASMEGKPEDIDNIEKIVKLLLKHDVVVNVSNMFGVTPFMLACQNGFKNIVEMLVTQVSRDSKDNTDNGPLFYAIENNHADIVEILVKNDFNATNPNLKGYTPREVARMHGFDDILEILPKRKSDQFDIPHSYTKYSSLKDYIPQIFLKPNSPEYFPEIYNLLTSFNLQKYLINLANNHVNLERFLTLKNQDLNDLGYEMDLSKDLIKRALLCYHLCNWNDQNIRSAEEKDNFYSVLVAIAQQLREILKIKCSLQYVKHNMEEGIFGDVDDETMIDLNNTIKEYKTNLSQLQSTLIYLTSFRPRQNPLLIDYDEYLEKKRRRKIKRFFQYTSLILGFSVIICLKFKKVF